MKFNPITRRLFTDGSVPIKTLSCPYTMKWSGLRALGSGGARLCAVCERQIVDTAGMTDGAVLELVRQDESQCLKVDLSQGNVRVVNFDV